MRRSKRVSRQRFISSQCRMLEKSSILRTSYIMKPQSMRMLISKSSAKYISSSAARPIISNSPLSLQITKLVNLLKTTHRQHINILSQLLHLMNRKHIHLCKTIHQHPQSTASVQSAYVPQPAVSSQNPQTPQLPPPPQQNAASNQATSNPQSAPFSQDPTYIQAHSYQQSSTTYQDPILTKPMHTSNLAHINTLHMTKTTRNRALAHIKILR